METTPYDFFSSFNVSMEEHSPASPTGIPKREQSLSSKPVNLSPSDFIQPLNPSAPNSQISHSSQRKGNVSTRIPMSERTAYSLPRSMPKKSDLEQSKVLPFDYPKPESSTSSSLNTSITNSLARIGKSALDSRLADSFLSGTLSLGRAKTKKLVVERTFSFVPEESSVDHVKPRKINYRRKLSKSTIPPQLDTSNVSQIFPNHSAGSPGDKSSSPKRSPLRSAPTLSPKTGALNPLFKAFTSISGKLKNKANQQNIFNPGKDPSRLDASSKVGSEMAAPPRNIRVRFNLEAITIHEYQLESPISEPEDPSFIVNSAHRTPSQIIPPPIAVPQLYSLYDDFNDSEQSFSYDDYDSESIGISEVSIFEDNESVVEKSQVSQLDNDPRPNISPSPEESPIPNESPELEKTPPLSLSPARQRLKAKLELMKRERTIQELSPDCSFDSPCTPVTPEILSSPVTEPLEFINSGNNTIHNTSPCQDTSRDEAFDESETIESPHSISPITVPERKGSTCSNFTPSPTDSYIDQSDHQFSDYSKSPSELAYTEEEEMIKPSEPLTE